jgi:hypothetical protein
MRQTVRRRTRCRGSTLPRVPNDKTRVSQNAGDDLSRSATPNWVQPAGAASSARTDAIFCILSSIVLDGTTMPFT